MERKTIESVLNNSCRVVSLINVLLKFKLKLTGIPLISVSGLMISLIKVKLKTKIHDIQFVDLKLL